MSDISETKWKSNLTSIVEDLDTSQYKKMQAFLTKIPKSLKTGRSREQMPQIIIEHYGLEESISAINDAMNMIPRRDSGVQDLLRPFVDKLRNKNEKESEERRRKPDPEQEGNGPAAGKKRKRDPVEKENKPPTDQQKSCQPNTETNTGPGKKSICDLKSSTELSDTDRIVGKVVQISGLRTYQTKDKVKRNFFYVALADETASVRLMVYGKEHYKLIKEEKYFSFRKLIRDDRGVIKVTGCSVVSQTNSVKVPEEIEKEARELIYSERPVYSIANIKSSADRTGVSVEGTIKEIDPVKHSKVQHKQEKIKRQSFKLSDETDSIKIQMWGEETKHCKGLSVGDVIKVTNLKTNQYYETVSLNSTVSTKIQKIESVGIQNVSIEIIGIIKATKKETQLEAEVSQEAQIFVVASRLLAEAFDFTLDRDFKETLLNKMPLTAEAVIQGSKIKKITTTCNM